MTIKIVLGVILAAAGWGAMFVLRRDGFWTRAALAGAAIGIYAVAVEPTTIGHLFDRRHWAGDLGVGVVSGAVLYAVFWVGEQALVIILPKLAVEVGDLYAVRGRTSPWFMPLVLAIAAPGEELFFRGFLQHQAGVAIALAIYGAVHLWERKVILVLAALLGGLWWGALFTWTGGLIAPVVSHLLWCLIIIVWRPARPTEWARRTGGRLRGAFGH
ncbi:MAG: CPBP family intramembrane metalloprotease [Actinomycetota bacterium]|nr:CPBP family intramembrane metalloprotease [Actinomycetota bacterium]